MMKKNWMRNLQVAALAMVFAAVGITAEAQAAPHRGLIGWEKAEAIVLEYLDLEKEDLRDKEYELDDGVYQLEFFANGREYEFEIHGTTGKILEAESEREDDDRWDDDDHWDDDRWDDDDDDRWDDDDDRWDDDDDDRWDDDDDDDDDRWDD